jgi:hypothetical protein
LDKRKLKDRETPFHSLHLFSPLPGQTDNPATYIELVVDGNIVDLNRIPLAAHTPIIDERFKDGKKK